MLWLKKGGVIFSFPKPSNLSECHSQNGIFCYKVAFISALGAAADVLTLPAPRGAQGASLPTCCTHSPFSFCWFLASLPGDLLLFAFPLFRSVKRGWEQGEELHTPATPGWNSCWGACLMWSRLCNRSILWSPTSQHHCRMPTLTTGHDDGSSQCRGRGWPLPRGHQDPSLCWPGVCEPMVAACWISRVKLLMLPLRGRLLSVSGSL